MLTRILRYLRDPRQPSQRQGIVILIVFLGCAYVGLRLFLRAHPQPWGVPEVSPDGRFELRCLEVQKLFPRLMAMPGDGSWGKEGFIVLYDRRSAQELRRGWCNEFMSVNPTWADKELIIQGDPEYLWPLPK